MAYEINTTGWGSSPGSTFNPWMFNALGLGGQKAFTSLSQTEMVANALKEIMGAGAAGSGTAGSGSIMPGGANAPGRIGGFNFMDAAGNRVGGVDLNGNTVQSPVQANQGSVWSPAFASQARTDLMRPVAAGANPGAIPGVVGADAAQRIGGQYADMARGMANQSAAGLNMAGQAGEADYFGKAQAARGQSQLAGQQLLNSMYGTYKQDDLAGARLALQQAGLNQNDQMFALSILSKMMGGTGGDSMYSWDAIPGLNSKPGQLAFGAGKLV